MPVEVKDRNYFPTSDDGDVAMNSSARRRSLGTWRAVSAVSASAAAPTGGGERQRRRRGSRAALLQSDRKPGQLGHRRSRKIRPCARREDLKAPSSLRARGDDQTILCRQKYSRQGGILLGATEVKASLPGVGGVVDITETGSNCVPTNCASWTPSSPPPRGSSPTNRRGRTAKRAKIEDMALLLQGAIDGKRKRWG